MYSFEEMNLKFLNNEFSDGCIPKEHQFLYKYFRNKHQKKFLEYCYVMKDGNLNCFQDHTGIKMTSSFIWKLTQRYNKLMEIHKKAKEKFDFDLLKNLERGNLFIKEVFSIKDTNVN
jgi:hypothetical protein